MVAEKSNMRSRWPIEAILLCRGNSEQDISSARKCGEKPHKGEGLPRQVSWWDRLGTCGGDAYWRMTTRKPRRQLSAKPTRVLSRSGERKRKRVSVDGW